MIKTHEQGYTHGTQRNLCPAGGSGADDRASKRHHCMKELANFSQDNINIAINDDGSNTQHSCIYFVNFPQSQLLKHGTTNYPFCFTLQKESLSQSAHENATLAAVAQSTSCHSCVYTTIPTYSIMSLCIHGRVPHTR